MSLFSLLRCAFLMDVFTLLLNIMSVHIVIFIYTIFPVVVFFKKKKSK